ncbi:hypothetical protein [Enterococcus saccharolyticus]|uniref:hypothetical protein n=1 Tax=Enterococcus saccharolyticus TaxID=41997 RepID=UPI00039C6A71|nr:hypothetical protein [Enterococcus saccharolyticus]
MKKTITVIMSLILVVSSLVFTLYYKEKDINNIENIGRLNNSFEIYIKNSKMNANQGLTTLESIARKYDASIIRTDEIYRNNILTIYKSGIFAENYFETLDINLRSGRLPNDKDEIIATYKTENSNQVGLINDMFNDTPLVFGPLQAFFKDNNTSINGKYTIVVEDKESFLNSISTEFDLDKADLLNIPYFKEYKQGVIFYILIGIVAILVLLLMMVIFFEPLSNLKLIGVLKLQGFTNLHALRILTKNQLIIPIILLIMSIPIHFFLIPNVTIEYLVYLIFLQILILIFYNACLLFSLIIIDTYKLSNMIKNYFNTKLTLYFNYLCKFIIFTILILIIPSVSSGINMLIENLNVQSIYEEQKKYVTLSNYEYTGNEFQESLDNNRILSNKVLNFFKTLEKNSDAEYMFSEKLLPIDLDPINTKEYKDIHFKSNDFYHVVQANWNYINKFNLINKNNIISNSFNLLVPINQKSETKKIEAFIKPHINSYIEESKRYTSIDEIPVTILYYYEDIELFSNNIELIDDNKGLLNNPIILLMDEYSLTANNSRLLDSAISNPLKIINTENHLDNIQKAITQHNLEDNNLKLTDAFSAGYKTQLDQIKISTSVMIIVLLLFLCISSLSSFYISLITIITQRKELLVSRFLGYSFLDRYKRQIVNVLIIYIFGTIESIVLGVSILSLIIYLTMLVLDFSILSFMLKKQDSLLLSTSLKGGSL